jgi:putative transposase
MAVVQVDHTEADVILVEESTRLPIGRPWMTLAIDVYTRMVVGLYVTFEHPSTVSVGMCLANAMLPKAEYLAELDVPNDWPVWGKMGVVHVDNAKEFRGNMLKLACQEYGIDLQMRPVKVPHYGGHVERLMGTMANEIRKLPGATFSSPAKRKGYNSEAKAMLTLREFEQYLVDFIVNIYHKRIHSELSMPPFRKWELGIVGEGKNLGMGLPAIPGDPYKLRLDFMPFIERSVQPYGLRIDKISYYSEVLNPWINSRDPACKKNKRKFIIRRDPRDISCVHFFDPESKQYYLVPYRHVGYPAMSLWELREVMKRIRAEGRAHVDEDIIFEALERMRTRVADAKDKSKAARRKLVRNPSSKEARKIVKTSMRSEPPSRPQSVAKIEDDIFATPPEPFTVILGE